VSFQRAFEHTAAIAERLPSVEQEAAALRERVAAGGRPFRVVTGVDPATFNARWLSTVTRC